MECQLKHITFWIRGKQNLKRMSPLSKYCFFLLDCSYTFQSSVLTSLLYWLNTDNLCVMYNSQFHGSILKILTSLMLSKRYSFLCPFMCFKSAFILIYILILIQYILQYIILIYILQKHLSSY